MICGDEGVLCDEEGGLCGDGAGEGTENSSWHCLHASILARTTSRRAASSR